tara:strand:+ start:6792 stop:7310 length:519 start_codon:yes stop_codon:yes gene_type:complete
MTQRHQQGVARLRAHGITQNDLPYGLTTPPLHCVWALHRRDLLKLTVGSESLTRKQWANALYINPLTFWHWTQHPEFPQPVQGEDPFKPTAWHWFDDDVVDWLQRHAPISTKHRAAWWLFEATLGLWHPEVGYYATPNDKALFAEHQKATRAERQQQLEVLEAKRREWEALA